MGIYNPTGGAVPPGALSPANTLEVAKANRPFTVIQTAINAAVAGQTVVVYPGTYNENLTLKNGVNLYCLDGVIVQAAANAPVVRDNGAVVICAVDGFGLFQTTAVLGTEVLSLTGGGSQIWLRCKNLNQQKVFDGAVVGPGCFLWCECESIQNVAAGGSALNNNAGTVFFQGTLYATGTTLVNSGIVDVKGAIQNAAAGAPLAVDNSGTTRIYGEVNAPISNSGGLLELYGDLTTQDKGVICPGGDVRVYGPINTVGDALTVDASTCYVWGDIFSAAGNGIVATNGGQVIVKGRLSAGGNLFSVLTASVVRVTGYMIAAGAVGTVTDGDVTLYGRIDSGDGLTLNGAAKVRHRGDMIVSGASACIGSTNAAVEFYGFGTYQTAANTGSVIVTAGYVEIYGIVYAPSSNGAGGNAAISVTGTGNVFVQGRVISANRCVNITGGTALIRGEVLALGGNQAAFCNGGVLTLRDGHVSLTPSGGAAKQVIAKNAGTVMLQGIAIVLVGGGAGTSLDGNAGQVYLVYGNIVANVAASGAIVISVGTLTVNVLVQ